MASKKHQVYPVRDLAVLVEKHPSAYLGEDELKKLSVDVVPMDLYTGIPADGQQQFCKPYPREQFDKIFEERKDSIDWERCGMLHKANHTDSQPKSIGFHDYDAYDDATYTEYMLDELLFGGPKLSNKCEYRFRGHMRSPSEGLFCTREKTREKWQVHKVMDVKDPSLPHFTCVLFENTIPQEMGLRRSELYSALGPMIGRYCERTDDRLRDPGPIFRYRHHQFAPTIVCSLAADKARIIQTHYDPVHERLIVRKTPIFTVERVIDNNSKLFLRWIMNIPCGKTLNEPSDNGMASHTDEPWLNR